MRGPNFSETVLLGGIALVALIYPVAASAQVSTESRPAKSAAINPSLEPRMIMPPVKGQAGPPHQRIQGKNYEIVRMHHPRTEDDAGMGPLIERINNGGGKLVIANYSEEGTPGEQISKKQRLWIEQVLPALANRSKVPVLFLDITATRFSQQDNTLEPAFMVSLLTELQRIMKRKDGTPFQPGKDPTIMPFTSVTYGNADHERFSYILYPSNYTDEQRRDLVLSRLLDAVREANEQYENPR